MTSNLGNELIEEYSIGFSDESDQKQAKIEREKEMKEKINDVLKDFFKLEFLNRIDEIIVFKSLNEQTLTRIVDLELAKLEKRLKNKDIIIKISQKMKKMLASKGYDITFGARPLKRIIQNLILDELAMKIIEGKVKEGDKITIDIDVKEKVMMRVR